MIDYSSVVKIKAVYDLFKSLLIKTETFQVLK